MLPMPCPVVAAQLGQAMTDGRKVAQEAFDDVLAPGSPPRAQDTGESPACVR